MLNYNYFKNLKDFYSFVFDNFKLVSGQQKKLVETFIESQPEIFKDNFKKVYDEWIKNVDKAFNDYQDMVFKGLEYLENMYENATKKMKQ